MLTQLLFYLKFVSVIYIYNYANKIRNFSHSASTSLPPFAWVPSPFHSFYLSSQSFLVSFPSLLTPLPYSSFSFPFTSKSLHNFLLFISYPKLFPVSLLSFLMLLLHLSPSYTLSSQYPFSPLSSLSHKKSSLRFFPSVPHRSFIPLLPFPSHLSLSSLLPTLSQHSSFKVIFVALPSIHFLGHLFGYRGCHFPSLGRQALSCVFGCSSP